MAGSAFGASPQIALRFGANLLAARRRARITQEELSRCACLDRTEIGHLEKGRRVARIDTLLKLAGALEIPAADLLAGMAWLPGSPWRTDVGRFEIGP